MKGRVLSCLALLCLSVWLAQASETYPFGAEVSLNASANQRWLVGLGRVACVAEAPPYGGLVCSSWAQSTAT